MEYASNGKGNLGVTLGAIGTGLGALNGTGLLSGMMGNCNNNGYPRGYYAPFVTRDELFMQNQISEKDAKIALLTAESNTEEKMIEVYKQVRSEIKELEDKVDKNRREQDGWNAAQAVANAQMSSAISKNKTDIDSIQLILRSITQIRVPNNAVCPGWGEVTVTPVTPTP